MNISQLISCINRQALFVLDGEVCEGELIDVGVEEGELKVEIRDELGDIHRVKAVSIIIK